MTVINTLAYIFFGAYFGTVIGDYVFKKDGKVRILFSIVIFLISVTSILYIYFSSKLNINVSYFFMIMLLMFFSKYIQWRNSKK